MRGTATRSEALDRLVAALQTGFCNQAAARQLYTLGPDAVTLALATCLAPGSKAGSVTLQAAALRTPNGGPGGSDSTPPAYCCPAWEQAA